MSDSLTLDDLVGEHWLDAVDFTHVDIEIYGHVEQCQVMRFRLDGEVYNVVEDPDDGYRSSMREIVKTDSEMSNVFGPVSVIGRMRETSQYGDRAEVLQLIDVENGCIILEAGTDSVDDYYPVFVDSFMPENMAVNQRRKR